jgi:hypothetical protein
MHQFDISGGDHFCLLLLERAANDGREEFPLLRHFALFIAIVHHDRGSRNRGQDRGRVYSSHSILSVPLAERALL